MAIVVRKDLGMRAGKIAVQASHAAVLSVVHNPIRKSVIEWIREGQKKIVLKVGSEEELNAFTRSAALNGLLFFKVFDYGLTQVDPGTFTCVAIGPDEDEKIDKITSGLSLL